MKSVVLLALLALLCVGWSSMGVAGEPTPSQINAAAKIILREIDSLAPVDAAIQQLLSDASELLRAAGRLSTESSVRSIAATAVRTAAGLKQDEVEQNGVEDVRVSKFNPPNRGAPDRTQGAPNVGPRVYPKQPGFNPPDRGAPDRTQGAPYGGPRVYPNNPKRPSGGFNPPDRGAPSRTK